MCLRACKSLERMKKILLSLTLLGTLSLAACGSKDKNESNEAPQSLAAKQMKAGPSASTSPLLRLDTIKRSGSTIIVSVDRNTDKQLPTVKDINDTEFYDNAVTITVRKDGSQLLSRTFRKTDFEAYLPAKDKAHSVFQGMAFIPEASSANAFHFGAQIGEPGLDGEGPAFTVVLDAANGISITRVVNQDTTLDDMQAEETEN